MDTHSKKSRLSVHRAHIACKDHEKSDTLVLSHIQSSTVLLAQPDVSELVVGEGIFVYGFHISTKLEYSLAWITKGSGEILGITAFPNYDIVVASTSKCGKEVDFSVISPVRTPTKHEKNVVVNSRRLCLSLKGTFQSMAPSVSGNVFVTIAEDPTRRSSSIVKIDTNAGRVTWEQKVSSSNLMVKTDPGGTWLTALDYDTGTSTTTSAASPFGVDTSGE